MRIADDTFARVGMRVETERARAFAATLGAAADAARDEPGPVAGDTGWAWRAVDRAIGALSRCELGALVADLGLGTAAFAGDDRADPDDPLRAVLRHLLRDRLVDVLRLSAGQRPFWCWPALAHPQPGGAVREA